MASVIIIIQSIIMNAFLIIVSSFTYRVAINNILGSRHPADPSFSMNPDFGEAVKLSGFFSSADGKNLKSYAEKKGRKANTLKPL